MTTTVSLKNATGGAVVFDLRSGKMALAAAWRQTGEVMLEPEARAVRTGCYPTPSGSAKVLSKRKAL